MRRSNVVIPGDKADGAGDVNKSVCAVQDSEGGLVAGHKPVLNAVFGQGEEEAKGPKLFEFEDGETVGFGDVPDGFGEDLLGDDLGEAVKEVGDDPVEHFDEEGEFLQDAAVDVVGETGGVGGVYCHPAASSPLWEVFRG